VQHKETPLSWIPFCRHLWQYLFFNSQVQGQEGKVYLFWSLVLPLPNSCVQIYSVLSDYDLGGLFMQSSFAFVYITKWQWLVPGFFPAQEGSYPEVLLTTPSADTGAKTLGGGLTI